MKTKILIVEDEFLIAQSIIEDLQTLEYDPIVPHCTSYDEAVELIKTQSPDLALVDLRLRGSKDGSELGAYIQEYCDFPYVFLTSNFNPRLFNREPNLKPAGILTKPFHLNNLFATIEFALLKPGIDSEEVVVLPGAPKKERLLKKDILYVRADQNYSHLYLENRQLTVRMSLKDLQKVLGTRSFQQVHRSYLVGLEHVTGFKAGYIFVSEEKVPIGRAFKLEILARLKGEL